MCFNKNKPIKLGQIKNNKLEKFSKSLTWDLDFSICVFLRDSLKEFKKVKIGYPAFLQKEYEREEDAIAYYDSIIDEIIEGFDYYLKDSYDLLSVENMLIFADFSERFPTPEEMKSVFSEIDEIEKEKAKKLERSFDLLKEWHPSFWIWGEICII